MYKARYHKSTAQDPGHRTNGIKKSYLIDLARIELLDIAGKGVNGKMLLKHLGISRNTKAITTKQWTGVIGRLKEFRKENGI